MFMLLRGTTRHEGPNQNAPFFGVSFHPLRGGVDTRVCKVALAATHYIEFCVSKAAIGLSGVWMFIKLVLWLIRRYCPSKPPSHPCAAATTLAQRSR
jgi:hypothetical protein